MKPILFAAAFALATGTAHADPRTYAIDPTHAQATFSYNHAGFSSTSWLISGFEGQIVFDRDNPEASSVTASIATEKLFSGDPGRDGHILQSGDFFKLADYPTASFVSSAIEVTGETTALITGDLTLNGVSKPIVLDAVLNAETEDYPFPPYNGKAAIGLSATGQILRSEFGLGMFAPFVGDEVSISLSIEAMELG